MQGRFRIDFDADAVRDVKAIREEIEKEQNEETPDDEKLQKLYLKELQRGLELSNNLYYRNNGNRFF